MILGANQPYFIPYIGYWQLINAVDIFVFADDYNFIKNGWISRNRILVNGEPQYFNLSIQHASQNKWINELFLCDIPVEQKMKQLENAYRKAPYYNDGMWLMEDILQVDEKNLAIFLEHSIKKICGYLDICTKFMRSSQLEHNHELKREYRIYDMCKRLGADTYYNAIGGQQLYSHEEFQNQGIKLGFLKSNHVVYKQYGEEFIDNLSIIDVIMFISKKQIKKMLSEYTIIGENNNV